MADNKWIIEPDNGFMPELIKPEDYFKRDVSGEHELVNYDGGTTIRIWKNRENYGFPNHWHSAIEIIMPLENTYTVRTFDNTFLLQEGDILIIPPGELHELIAPNNNGTRMIYLFDFSIISKLNGFSGIIPLMTSPILINRDNAPRIYDSARDYLFHMSEEYGNAYNLYELVIYSYIINFFVLLGRNHIDTGITLPNVRTSKQKEYVEKFARIFDYIDNHYTEDITLEDVAEASGFSKFHFSRLFKQYTGNTFSEYLTYKRVRLAEDLLAKRELSITDVALQSGFTSISTFNRIFKASNQCRPSEYRELHNFRGATQKKREEWNGHRMPLN